MIADLLQIGAEQADSTLADRRPGTCRPSHCTKRSDESSVNEAAACSM